MIILREEKATRSYHITTVSQLSAILSHLHTILSHIASILKHTKPHGYEIHAEAQK